MAMFLVRHPTVFIFFNLFVLLDCPVMLLALILTILHANRTTNCLRNQSRTKGEGWSIAKLVEAPPSNFINCCPSQGASSVFGSLGVRCGVWLCFVILVRYKNRK